MAVGSVQNFSATNVHAYQPQFKGANGAPEVKDIDRGDFIERRVKTEGATGKKWGVGIASAFMSGLGQFINGDVGKGFGFLVAGAASYAAMIAGTMKGSKGKGLSLGGALATLGINIWSIVDAVKNAKSETVQIVNKGE